MCHCNETVNNQLLMIKENGSGYPFCQLDKKIIYAPFIFFKSIFKGIKYKFKALSPLSFVLYPQYHLLVILLFLN